ncbi:hypothetical protein [Tsukamurella serpentis]
MAAVSQALEATDLRNPRCTLLSNRDGYAVTDARDFAARFLAQMTRSVRWDLCMEAIRGRGADAILHLPPTRITHRLQLRSIPDIPFGLLDSPRQAMSPSLSRVPAPAE